MEKKKVLFAVHQLNFGGVQKALLSTLNALDYSKYDVTVYIRKNRLDLLPLVNKYVKIIVNDDKRHLYCRPYAVYLQLLCKILSLKKNKSYESTKTALSKYVAEKKIKYEGKKFFAGEHYDVAISYIQGYPAKLLAEYIHADKKVMFFHGSTDESHDLHESIFDKIDTIVGVNEGVCDVLKHLYPAWKNKMTYIRNYVDAAEIVEKSKENIVAITDEKVKLCTCGRFSKVKGFDIALKTAKILKEKNKDFVWYFVGDGPEKQQIENAIQEYGVRDNIVITGMQSNPYPWIASCDIYVQPSYEEAHPLSVIEAQILCRPVVSTATVGGKHLVEDGINGLLSEINENDLAVKIEKLMNDSELKNNIINNLKKIDHSKEFDEYKASWEKLLEG